MPDRETGQPLLPRAKDVLAEVAGASSPSEVSRRERKYIERFGRNSADMQAEYAHLKGIEDHYKHKGRWSNFLILTIAAMLVFQSYLLVMVGTAKWSFVEYEWLLPALLVQNLAQVVGLSVWAVKYLFSDISSQKPSD